METAKCPVCSIEFTKRQGHQIYCSEKCANRARHRLKRGADIKNIPTIHIKCPYCDAVAERPGKVGGGQMPKTCGNVECMRKNRAYLRHLGNIKYRAQFRAGTKELWASKIPEYNLEDRLEQKEIYRLIRKERHEEKTLKHLAYIRSEQSLWDKHVKTCVICGNKYFSYSIGSCCSKRCDWRKANKNKANVLHVRVGRAISTRFSQYIRGYKPKSESKWNGILRYSFDMLKAHLESLFEPGMTWGNYGSKWHIDHIYPISKFDWSNQLKAMSSAYELKNLMPRWKTTAIAKAHGSRQVGNTNKGDSLCLTA